MSISKSPSKLEADPVEEITPDYPGRPRSVWLARSHDLIDFSGLIHHEPHYLNFELIELCFKLLLELEWLIVLLKTGSLKIICWLILFLDAIDTEKNGETPGKKHWVIIREICQESLNILDRLKESLKIVKEPQRIHWNFFIEALKISCNRQRIPQ